MVLEGVCGGRVFVAGTREAIGLVKVSGFTDCEKLNLFSSFWLEGLSAEFLIEFDRISCLDFLMSGNLV
jgi:hypothetical protein